MYIGIDSRLIDFAKPELLTSCYPNERESVVFPPPPPLDHSNSLVAWELPKWADNLDGRGDFIKSALFGL